MSLCIFVDTDGRLQPVSWDQRTVAHRLGGAVTFVGGIQELGIVFVGLAVCASGDVNPLYLTHKDLFFPCTPPVRGPIVMIASDEAGDEMDVDVDEVGRMLMD